VIPSVFGKCTAIARRGIVSMAEGGGWAPQRAPFSIVTERGVHRLIQAEFKGDIQ
jgi:hypothetical protein